MTVTGLIWHLMTVLALASAAPTDRVPTHVETTGYVAYIKREADGDLHLRICDGMDAKGMDRARCIVAECIPPLPCALPHRGDRVRLRGITRYDSENGHRWREIHPVLALTVEGR